MTPFELFLYIVAIFGGVIVSALLGVVLAIVFIVGCGGTITLVTKKNDGKKTKTE